MFYAQKPQFFGIRAAASNIGQNTGNYSLEFFQQLFPQFFNAEGEPLVPLAILNMFINQANACIQPDKWLDKWEYACGLYVAHRLTLYLKTYATSSETSQQAANSGTLTGTVKSAKLGNAQIEYDTSTITTATEAWGDFNSTIYGQQLATEARLIGMGGSYAI